MTRRAGVSRWLPALFLVAAVSGGAWAIASRWAEVRQAFAGMSLVSIAAAYAVALVAVSATVLPWRALIAELGSPLPLRVAARVILLGQLGKYVPGSVWPLLAQMELAREYHVPRKRSMAATLLGISISVVCGLLIAALFLPLSAPAAIEQYWWALLAAPLLVTAMHPQIMVGAFDRLLRLAGREPLGQRPSYSGMLRAAGWQTLVWLILGVHTYLLMLGLGAHSWRSLAVAVGGMAFAFSAGLLVVPAPAGAGVREVVLVLALSPVLALPEALTLVVISRVVLTAVDFTLALAVGMLRGPAVTRRTSESEHETDHRPHRSDTLR